MLTSVYFCGTEWLWVQVVQKPQSTLFVHSHGGVLILSPLSPYWKQFQYAAHDFCLARIIKLCSDSHIVSKQFAWRRL